MEQRAAVADATAATKRWQECVRRVSLTFGGPHSHLHSTGWAQILSIRATYDSFADHANVRFVGFTDGVLAQAHRGLGTGDMSGDVRGLAKMWFKWPLGPGEFPPWVPLHESQTLGIIQRHLNHQPHTLRVVEGRLFLMLPSVDPIADQIGWTGHGPAHVTVVGSDAFDPEVHGAFEGQVVSDMEYCGIDCTRPLDWPKMAECVVAACRSASGALRRISDGSFHWTFRAKLRQPYRWQQEG